MKFGIDGTPLAIPYHCGQKHYLENLIRALAKIDKKDTFYIFCPKKVKLPKQNNFKLVVLPKIPFLKRQVVIPLLAKQKGVDVLHYPDVIGSVFFKTPKIITTIHDLAPDSSYPSLWESPNYFLMKIYNNFVKNFTLKNSSALITVSQTIKGELKQKLRTDAPVFSIYEGTDSNFKPQKNAKKKNYILAMADFSPRKNITRTLESFSLARLKINKNIKLKIIVSTSYPVRKLMKLSNVLGIKKYLDVEKNVPQKRLIKLYNHAIVFLYPSLYEGFGLPIVEAMSCGCPVVTSNYGSMKEVSGNATGQVDPLSVNDISDKIIRIANSKKIQKKLIILGLRRVKKFTWKNTAQKTLKVYRQIAEK